jgi:hypothetical protein
MVPKIWYVLSQVFVLVAFTKRCYLNQFIVDGGIHPDLPTGNIQATIMVVAEAAV